MSVVSTNSSHHCRSSTTSTDAIDQDDDDGKNEGAGHQADCAGQVNVAVV